MIEIYKGSKVDVSKLESLILSSSKDFYAGKKTMPNEVYDTYVTLLGEVCPDSEVFLSTKQGKFNFQHGIKEHPNNSSFIDYPHITQKMFQDSLIESQKNFGYPYDHLVIFPNVNGCIIDMYFNNGHLTRALTRGYARRGETITDKILPFIPPEGLESFTGRIGAFAFIKKERWENLFLKKDTARLFVSNLLNSPLTDMSQDIIIHYVSLLCFDVESFGDSFLEFVSFSDNFKEVELLPMITSLVTSTSYENDTITNADFSQVIGEQLSNNEFDYCGLHVLAYGKMNYKQEFIVDDERTYHKILHVNSIDWKISRFGTYVPYACFDELVGVNNRLLSGICLYNVDEVKNIQIGKGSVISLACDIKNEFVPYVDEVLIPSTEIQVPMSCPFCGEPLTDELICNNPQCVNRDYESLIYFCRTLSKDGLPTDALYRSIFEFLHINNIIDFMASPFSNKDIITFCNRNPVLVGNVMIDTIVNHFQKIKNGIYSFEDIISAVGIHGLERHTVNAIFDEYLLSEIVDNVHNHRIIHPPQGVSIESIDSLQDNLEFLLKLKDLFGTNVILDSRNKD